MVQKMKNKYVLICLLLFFTVNLFAQINTFTVINNYSWYDDLDGELSISKDENLYQRENAGIGFATFNGKEIIQISLTNADELVLYIPIQYVKFNKNRKEIPNNIKESYWIPNYYYEQIQSIQDRYSILYKNEPFWYNWQNEYESSITWQEDFNLGFFIFNDFYLIAKNSQNYYGEATFLLSTEEVSEKQIKYKVYNMYSRFQNYTKTTAHPQEKFLPLYKKETPYYIYLTIDGDYMNMYIDEISDKNLFQTLIRTTPEACDQIEKWIKGESNDLSKVVMPKHGNNSATTTSQKSSTNVAPNKLMSVTENLKLRSGEVTTTSVLTVMSTGTKVKILELGKAENIDGIDSNWVKVEVQKGAKDRDGKEIKEGTVGWCYGGYLKDTANTDSVKKRNN